MSDGPLMVAIRVSQSCLTYRTPAARVMDTFVNTATPSLSTIIDTVCNDIAQSDLPRCMTYKEANSRFPVNENYRQMSFVKYPLPVSVCVVTVLL